MLGIGLLALVGVGLAMSAGGGGDDSDLIEDMIDLVDEDDTSETPDIPLTPEDEPLDEDAARIEAFRQELLNNPNLSAEEAAERLNEFIAALAAEDDVEPPVTETPIAETPAPETPEEVLRPPTGGGFTDPLDTPQAPFVPDARDDSGTPGQPQGPAASAEQLVTVTRPSGDEFDDDRVLEDGPTTGPDADRDHIVETGLERNDILVGYDSQTTFLIKYTGATDSVTASLNSDIEGPRGAVGTAVSTDTDENGTDFEVFTSSRNFTDSVNILMDVSQEQIGVHVSQIDLQNPNDNLIFNFDSDVTGNLHLVFNDAEEDSLDDSLITRTLFVIETASSVTSLSVADIARILSEDGNAAQSTRLVAEVNLGFESVRTTGDPDDLEPYTVTIANFINENPNVSSNIGWTSTTEFDGSIPTGGGTGGGAPVEPEIVLPTFPAFPGFGF